MSRWISLFGLRRTQPKTRRPRPTVKPWLEELENLILPSASPAVVEPMSQMVLTMTQLISTVKNEVSSIDKMIGQEVAQEVAYVEQQLDRILGINPNAQNQSLGTAVSQPGSGSGSGSGATTTAHNAPNQPLNSGTQKSGGGSGSGTTTKAHESAAPSRVAPLDGNPATDTLEWDPNGGSEDAALASNWYDVPQMKRGVTAPGATNPILFDGKFSNSPIEWTANASAASIKLQEGYTALMTIDAGISVTDNGTLYVDDADPTTVSLLDLQFNDAKSTFNINGGGSITNMQLAGSYQAWFNLTGGTMNIAYDDVQDSLYDKIGVNVSVGKNAVLSDGGGNSLLFTNNNVQINVAGWMFVVYASNGVGDTLIDHGSSSNTYINVNGGYLYYDGNGGVVDTFTVPVYVQGGGSFILDEGAGADPGGQLIVQDGSNYKFPDGFKWSVYMGGADWSSSVQLNTGDTLECDDGYYQDGGTLETMDDTTCTLQDGKNSDGTAVIAGGYLAIDPSPGLFGYLDVNGVLDFSGVYEPQINGDGSDYDLLTVSGYMDIDESAATLQVVVNGDLQAENTWTIISTGTGIELNPFPFTNEAKFGLHETTTKPVGSYVLSY